MAPNQSSNDLPSMLARVIGVPYSSQVADFVPFAFKKLQALVPELYPEELNTHVQMLSDPSQKPHIFQLFEVAAYFSSNDLLQETQATTFVEWVSEHKHMTSLMLFLRQHWDKLTIQAFVSRLVEAGARMENKGFLQQLHGIGAKLDRDLERIMEINDPDFLAFVLAEADPGSLEGEPGGRLLRLVSRTPHIAVAELIINAKAEINIGLSKKVPTTPLWEAINNANLDMVKCLVAAGADINRYSAVWTTGFQPAATEALSLAVWKKDRGAVEYLLGLGVVIKGSVNQVPLLEYAADKMPDIYELLLVKSGGERKVTVEQVLKAADSDAELISEFLSQHPEVSERMLEEALVMALRKEKSTAVVNLLQHGVDANGSHLPDNTRCPLYTVSTDLLEHPVGHHYIDLLIDAKADVNVEGLLNNLVSDDEFYPSIINKLVDAGFDLTRYGPEALEQAIAHNYEPDPLLFLVGKGISVNSYGLRVTPFQAAALELDLELLKYLFQQGAEVNKPPFPIRGYTALQAAASSCSMEKLQFLLSKGADINAPPAVSGGVTALEATVRPWSPLLNDGSPGDEDYFENSELTETFIYLLHEKAVVNRPDGSSSPLLHDIIERQNSDLLKLALEAGANTTYRWETVSSSWCERTPLQLAAEMGQLEAVKLLLYYKADPNASPAFQHGRTALQAAASSETACVEAVRLLLAAGAAVNADPAPVGGITALQGAAIKGYFQIALLLLKHEANVNAPPAFKEGRTAVEGAAEHGRLDMVKMLLDAGAIGDGKTGFMRAISLARQNRHFAIVNLLET
ncbi:hypothetical protein FIE12Z_11557 [Fusarium flagelliforme]|uniref:Ankyrin repeat protein n=2 Tax=Fusarium flagelliforme TaxID=2675880 RepID=A0A395M8M9_9HYPO|nr:hypothetical protein FIE12Z_11557 [Fusarium flagelliforme]